MKGDKKLTEQQEELRQQARAVMETHWKHGKLEGGKNWGYTCPNSQTYPWQWLWDSCFHAVIWAELGEADRAVLELETLLATIEATGFVPHMNYVADPEADRNFWGRQGASNITQPPMFGHAIAELIGRGVDVPEQLIDRAAKGLRFFLKHRIHEPSGLVVLCHPWESGADDSLRWDSCYSVPYGHALWQEEKMRMLATIQRDGNGTPLRNPSFPVASAWFTALVAFNISELAAATDAIAAAEADGIVEAVESCWDDGLDTWTDITGNSPASRLTEPVLEALLCVLADRHEDRLAKVCEALFGPQKYGAPFGPAGVSQSHKAYDGDGYWRGATWPQLTYLLCHALASSGRHHEAKTLATQLRDGAATSNFAEHWHPQTAKAGGATPQSWAALAAFGL